MGSLCGGGVLFLLSVNIVIVVNCNRCVLRGEYVVGVVCYVFYDLIYVLIYNNTFTYYSI